MIYYVVLYFVRRYFVEHLKMVLVLSFLISIGLYFVYNDGYQYNMYGATYYKWIHYFIFMLQGAMMGLYSKQNAIEVKNGWIELGKTFVCVLLFYMFCSFNLNISYSV